MKAFTLPRVYPILDTGLLDRLGLTPVDAAEVLLAAGARILQLRHKGNYSRDTYDQCQKIAGRCLEHHALFIVNDRADIARLTGGGLHVGQDDLPVVDARRIAGPDAIIGFSTHNEGQLRSALLEPADYLALGPVFATGSKDNPDPVVGIDEFRRLRAIADRPLVAIGGITLANAQTIWSAGADSIAVISALFHAPCNAATLSERFKRWQAESVLL